MIIKNIHNNNKKEKLIIPTKKETREICSMTDLPPVLGDLKSLLDDQAKRM